ncbi:hypothetical protein EJ06DRAFT_126314 [Trichodelitschia bisporula]|uniref:Uncharacterized protein n=1 Tax=Trichodelitschia bisporula TaxID=703511 RepID=A0A6G1HQ55_9PEZI|nr:hypothetical protein EJ06DRAFT_126314 [Trichodelitschia bisporula]
MGKWSVRSPPRGKVRTNTTDAASRTCPTPPMVPSHLPPEAYLAGWCSATFSTTTPHHRSTLHNRGHAATQITSSTIFTFIIDQYAKFSRNHPTQHPSLLSFITFIFDPTISSIPHPSSSFAIRIIQRPFFHFTTRARNPGAGEDVYLDYIPFACRMRPTPPTSRSTFIWRGHWESEAFRADGIRTVPNAHSACRHGGSLFPRLPGVGTVWGTDAGGGCGSFVTESVPMESILSGDPHEVFNFLVNLLTITTESWTDTLAPITGSMASTRTRPGRLPISTERLWGRVLSPMPTFSSSKAKDHVDETIITVFFTGFVQALAISKAFDNFVGTKNRPGPRQRASNI